MKNRLLRIIILCLCVVLTVGCVACDSCESCGDKENVTVWTIDSTQKIAKDKSYDLTNVSCNITVSAGKNEYEGWQIIISANELDDEVEYEVFSSDLKNAEGSIFSAENINFYNECYIEVTPKAEYYSEPAMYPDALVPFEASKNQEENVIKNNENKAIFVEFYIPKAQASGIYSGSFKLKVGSEDYSIPVELDVRNFVYNDETTAKSIFLQHWEFGNGELNHTQEMYETYIDKLAEFRLCTMSLLLENNHSDDCIKQYTELAYKYASREDYSTIWIPFKQVATDATETYNGVSQPVTYTFDEDVFKKYVYSFAEKSFETGVNILAKSVCYFTIIDEPQLNGTQARAIYISSRFKALKAELSAEILAGNFNEEKISKQDIANAILGIDNVVTTSFEADYANSAIDYCPTVDYYDTESGRSNYANNERWWYCCVGPNYPYPTYHIDDHLLSLRLLYWMGVQYDVSGNLNWATNSYTVNGNVPEDYYEQSIHGSGQNGEGFLFYPGAKYDMDEPVISLRLQAYRDGAEEYELLRYIENKYEVISNQTGCDINFDSMISYLTNTLYDGMRWATTETNFYRQRENLMKIAEMAIGDDNQSVCIYDIKQVGSNFQLKLFASATTSIKLNGEIYTNGVDVNGGKIYSIDIDLSNYDSREVTLTSIIDGKETDLVFDIGGSIKSISVDEIADKLTSYDTSIISYETVEANAIGTYEEGKLIKMTLNGTPTFNEQGTEFVSDVLKELSSGINKMQFVLYSEEALEYQIHFMYSNGNKVNGKVKYELVGSGNISIGENYLSVVNLDSYNWEKNGTVDKVLITFKTEKTSQVYLREILLFGV